MEYVETLKWTWWYLGLWALAAVVGGAVVAVGVAIGGLAGLGLYGWTPAALRLAYYPIGGLVVMGLGLLTFKFGTAAALVHVVVNATEDRLPTALNTEVLKSDILSVLDERLSEMHGELTETRRLVNRSSGGEAEQFEFE